MPTARGVRSLAGAAKLLTLVRVGALPGGRSGGRRQTTVQPRVAWHVVCYRTVFEMNPPIEIDLSMSDPSERVKTFDALYVGNTKSFLGIASRQISKHWSRSLGSLESEDVAHDSYISVRRRIFRAPVCAAFRPFSYFSAVCCHKVRRAVSKRAAECLSLRGVALALAANSFPVASAVSDSPVQMFAEFAGNIGNFLTSNEQTLMADIFPLLVLGKGHQETARIVGCSTKTIQRLLKRIQTLVTQKKI